MKDYIALILGVSFIALLSYGAGYSQGGTRDTRPIVYAPVLASPVQPFPTIWIGDPPAIVIPGMSLTHNVPYDKSPSGFGIRGYVTFENRGVLLHPPYRTYVSNSPNVTLKDIEVLTNESGVSIQCVPPVKER